MAGVDLRIELNKCRVKTSEESDKLISEAQRIINSEAYRGKNILNNLKSYSRLSELVDESEAEQDRIYNVDQIKQIALKYRLRFVNSQNYKFEFPYEILLRIDHLNQTQKKDLKGFKILSTPDLFKKEGIGDMAILFAPTDQGNYYLVHQWGKPLGKMRKYTSWPFRNIESLFVSLLIFTAIVTLSIPTRHITLDRHATYWCGYRAGVFLHLLIFFMGFTAYFTFAFSRNLGTMMWDKDRDW